MFKILVPPFVRLSQLILEIKTTSHSRQYRQGLETFPDLKDGACDSRCGQISPIDCFGICMIIEMRKINLFDQEIKGHKKLVAQM